jgi:enoyl-CoA hydratase/carnithine racemase
MIAAVNGGAYGGGVEMILNFDIVIASENAKFALPEVKRGVVAAQGGMYEQHGLVLSLSTACCYLLANLIFINPLLSFN